MITRVLTYLKKKCIFYQEVDQPQKLRKSKVTNTHRQTYTWVHWQNVPIIHSFHEDLLRTFCMPGTILGPGNTMIPTLSRREAANKVQTLQFLSHDLSIPTVRPLHQATVAAVSARVPSCKNNLVYNFNNLN